MDIDAAVVGYAAGLRFEDLPAATRARTKLLVLDTVGAALAAIGADGVSVLEGLMRRWGGTPEAGVLGYGTRGPAPPGLRLRDLRGPFKAYAGFDPDDVFGPAKGGGR